MFNKSKLTLLLYFKVSTGTAKISVKDSAVNNVQTTLESVSSSRSKVKDNRVDERGKSLKRERVDDFVNEEIVKLKHNKRFDTSLPKSPGNVESSKRTRIDDKQFSERKSFQSCDVVGEIISHSVGRSQSPENLQMAREKHSLKEHFPSPAGKKLKGDKAMEIDIEL